MMMLFPRRRAHEILVALKTFPLGVALTPKDASRCDPHSPDIREEKSVKILRLGKVSLEDRCPAFALIEGHAEPATKTLHDQSLNGFGSPTEQVLKGNMERAELLRNLVASDLIPLFDAMVHSFSWDLT